MIVVGPRDPVPDGYTLVNTTSRSPEAWSRGLSPFHLGPVPLYEGAAVATATCVENAWQYAKVWAQHLGADGRPTAEYYAWAAAGWSNPRAVRYPMGKGGTPPRFSWWAGEPLTYLEARRKVYVPAYTRAVASSPAWARLLREYREGGRPLALWDFDGQAGRAWRDVLADPAHPMGHAHVLAFLLENWPA